MTDLRSSTRIFRHHPGLLAQWREAQSSSPPRESALGWGVGLTVGIVVGVAALVGAVLLIAGCAHAQPALSLDQHVNVTFCRRWVGPLGDRPEQDEMEHARQRNACRALAQRRKP